MCRRNCQGKVITARVAEVRMPTLGASKVSPGIDMSNSLKTSKQLLLKEIMLGIYSGSESSNYPFHTHCKAK